jgi:hypothetical protein
LHNPPCFTACNDAASTHLLPCPGPLPALVHHPLNTHSPPPTLAASQIWENWSPEDDAAPADEEEEAAANGASSSNGSAAETLTVTVTEVVDATEFYLQVREGGRCGRVWQGEVAGCLHAWVQVRGGQGGGCVRGPEGGGSRVHACVGEQPPTQSSLKKCLNLDEAGMWVLACGC